MKCPNSYICAICKQEYHHTTSHAEAIKEHEHRKRTVAGYVDGNNDDDYVVVCDDCFTKKVAPTFQLIN